MNREIKFRFWLSLNKKMTYSHRLYWVATLHPDETSGLLDGTIIPLQYTGIKDKNGGEIYEGDILRGFEYPYLREDGSENYVAVVEWCLNSWQMIITQVSDRVAGISDGINISIEDEQINFEIIGNIFENPEIINQ